MQPWRAVTVSSPGLLQALPAVGETAPVAPRFSRSQSTAKPVEPFSLLSNVITRSQPARAATSPMM